MKKILLTMGALATVSVAAYAQHNVTTNGARYSLIFEGTGAWCQFCGDGAIKLDAAVAAQSKAIGISVHDGDGMAFTDGDALNSNFTAAYPMGFVDMHDFGMPYSYVKKNVTPWDTTTSVSRTDWLTVANMQVTQTAKFDVTLSYSYDKVTRTITADVTVKALEAMTGKFNVNAVLTEDKVVGPNGGDYSQVNAYNTQSGHPHYGLGNPINGFEHNHVLRAIFGGTFGVAAFEDPAKDETVTKTFTYTIPAQYDVLTPNLDEMHLVAYVQDRHATGTPLHIRDASIHNGVEAKFLPWNPNDVANVEQLAEVSIFPNPANDYVYVKALLAEVAPVQVAITNSVGQVQYDQTFPAVSNFKENISVANLPNGVYFLKVSSNGQSAVERIVINR